MMYLCVLTMSNEQQRTELHRTIRNIAEFVKEWGEE